MDQEVSVATSNQGDGLTETPPPEPEEEKNMTILEHLEELRKRLIVMLIAVALATIASVVVANWAFDLLMWPARSNLPEFRPVYTEVTEMFSTYLKVALFTGIIMSTPVLVYEIAAFIAPGLTDRERRYLIFLIPGVFVALICGLVFGYLIVVPFAVRYLLGTDIFISVASPMIKISNYIEFVVNLLLAIGAAFELPIVVFFLTKVGIVNTRRLSSYRKYALLGAAVAAAIITPTPDPGTQMLVAVPLYILYEVGILLSRIA
ncbi:MAG: twin-arginine translocase subunit TatC [Chloroflexota bacterium]